MVWCSSKIYSVILLGTQILSLNCEKMKFGSEPRLFSNEVVDLETTYDFFTNNNISYRFTLILLFQVKVET